MRIILSFLLFLLFSFDSFSQNLNRKNILQRLQADAQSVFVLNGIPYFPVDSLALQSELAQINTNKIVAFEVVKSEGDQSFLRTDTILLDYAHLQNKKLIASSLKEIKRKFTDEYQGFSSHILTNSQDPVLYVNGHRIHYTEIQSILTQLTVDKLGYIYFLSAPQPLELHGSNGKNGVVILWTKDQL